MYKRKVKGIARETLEFILEASKSTYPKEFAGLLREDDGIITEVLILPGTESSERQAMVRLYMLPNMHVVGSVHSHPSSNMTPSRADLIFFARTGNCHIIAGSPFGMRNWICYDVTGTQRDLPVIDVSFNEDGSIKKET